MVTRTRAQEEEQDEQEGKHEKVELRKAHEKLLLAKGLLEYMRKDGEACALATLERIHDMLPSAGSNAVIVRQGEVKKSHQGSCRLRSRRGRSR